jgi:AbrB family looped-hinge helix DNA binding protein
MTTEEVISTVTHKGQVTIPAEFRKAHNIKEGSNVAFFKQEKDWCELTLVSLQKLEDLAGVDSGRISYKEAVKKLDRMRENDRY